MIKFVSLSGFSFVRHSSCPVLIQPPEFGEIRGAANTSFAEAHRRLTLIDGGGPIRQAFLLRFREQVLKAKSGVGGTVVPLPKEDHSHASLATKGVKLAMTEINDPTEPSTTTTAHRRMKYHFPLHTVEAIIGNLEQGFAIRGDELGVMMVVPGRVHLAKGKPNIDDEGHFELNNFQRGRKQGPNDIHISMMRHNKPEIQAKLKEAEAALMRADATLDKFYNDPQLLSVLQVGFEREFYIVDSKTGELCRIFDEELTAGQGEVRDGLDDVGIYYDPIAAARGTAMVRQKLEKKYPQNLLLDMATPPSGTPQNTRINTRALTHENIENKNAIWIASLASRHTEQFWPRTKASRRFRLKQAREAGLSFTPGRKSQDQALRRYFDLIADNRLWTVGAGHESVDLGNVLDSDSGRYEVDILHTVNTADVLKSLGSISRILTAGGPYLQNGLVTGEDGQPVFCARNAIRKDLGTAENQVHPLLTPENLVDIITQNITNGKHGIDRLARAGSAVTEKLSNGKQRVTKSISHGDIRVRTENNPGNAAPAGSGQATQNFPYGRLEYTGASAAHSLARARTMAFLQLLGFLALQATNRQQHVFDYIAGLLNDGTKVADLWINTDKVVDDYMENGPNSAEAQKLVVLLRKVIDKVESPAFAKTKQIAQWALDTVLTPDVTFTELARGKGTLGAAMVSLANRGVAPLSAAKMVHAFETAEGAFLRSASDEQIEAYFAGVGGFIYDEQGRMEPIRTAA